MKIRHANRSDFNEIASIHAESWKDAYKAEMPAEFLTGPLDELLSAHWRNVKITSADLVLVAQEQFLVGFVAIWCNPDPLIDNLHVRPSFRSRNIGTALMQRAAQELMARGHSFASLWAFDSNKKAIRFYERLGGLKEEKLVRNIFNFKIMSQKIVWPDLSIIGNIP